MRYKIIILCTMLLFCTMDNLYSQTRVNILPYIDSARSLCDSVDWCRVYRHHLKPLTSFPCDTNRDTIFVLENAVIPDPSGVVILSYWSKKCMYSVLMKDNVDTLLYQERNERIFDYWLMSQIESWEKGSLMKMAGVHDYFGKSIYYASRVIFNIGIVSVDSFSFEQFYGYPSNQDEIDYLHKLWRKKKRRFRW